MYSAIKTRAESPRNKKQSNTGTKHPRVGAAVYTNGKVGNIVTISGDVCTIQFSTGEKVAAKYPDAFENGQFTIMKI
jgi:hypothetical protein